MKKITVIMSSPNKDGLTALCGEEARQGCKAAGAEATMVRLNDRNIGFCKACNNGWGTCRNENYCQVEDDFQELHALMKDMDGFILITPVYWWDFSESAKAFIDRVRRCEAFKNDNFFIKEKPVISIAAAGGTGNGCVSCLAQMEKFVDHVKGLKYDFIGITQKNRQYKLNTIKDAAKSLVSSIKTRTV